MLLQSPPVSISNGQIQLPVEFLVALGLGGLAWLFKWLLSREIKRFAEMLEQHDRAIEVLERTDQSHQLSLAQLAKLEATLEQLREGCAQLDREVAQLPKQSEALARLQEDNGRLSERVQRLDNVGYALKQTQELLQQVQKDQLTLRAEVAKGYVSEEKYVRDYTVLDSRMGAIWERIDEVLGSRGRRLLEGRRESD
jgi:predicted nuclease with TOPRIM domain